MFARGRSGSSFVRFGGMGGRSRLRVRIGRLGMRSCRAEFLPEVRDVVVDGKVMRLEVR